MLVAADCGAHTVEETNIPLITLPTDCMPPGSWSVSDNQMSWSSTSFDSYNIPVPTCKLHAWGASDWIFYECFSNISCHIVAFGLFIIVNKSW